MTIHYFCGVVLLLLQAEASVCCIFINSKFNLDEPVGLLLIG